MRKCKDCKQKIIPTESKEKKCPSCIEIEQFKRKAARDDRKAKPKSPYEDIADKVRNGYQVLSESEANMALGFTIPSFERKMNIVLPFTWDLSKNRAFATTRRGGFYIRSGARKTKETLREILKIQYGNLEWRKDRVWLQILVVKPTDASHRGDCINFLDIIADCVKDAIGIDDRWFSVAKIDWSESDKPHIVISVGQEGHSAQAGTDLQLLLRDAVNGRSDQERDTKMSD